MRNTKAKREVFNFLTKVAILSAAAIAVIACATFYIQRRRARLERARVQTYISTARSHKKDLDYEKAIETYNKLVGLDPANLDALNTLGILYSTRGDDQKAVESFDKATALRIGSEKSYYNLANHYLSRGETGKAIQYYRRAAGVNEYYLAPRIMLAAIYDYQRRPKDALREYERILRIDGRRDREILRDRQLTGEALLEFKKFVKMKRVFNEGFMHEKRGEYGEAIEAYNDVLDMRPDFTLAVFRRGVVRFLQSDYAGARADLERVLREEPGNLIARCMLIDSLTGLGEKGRARDLLRSLATLSPKDAKFKSRIGLLCLERGDRETAEDLFKEALRIDPTCLEARNGLGSIYLGRGEYEKAEEQYRAAVSHSPEKPTAYYNLACLYSRKGENGEAFKWLTEALDKGYRKTGYMMSDPDLEGLLKDTTYGGRLRERI